MKFKILFFAVIVFCLTEIKAQRVAWTRFKFGVQASPSFTWMKTDDLKIRSNGFNTGLKLGATADYYFLENYALSTGVGFGFNHGGKLFHEVGGNFLANSSLSDNRYNTSNGKPLPDEVGIRYHLQYIEVPFALKMRTQPFGYLRVFAHAPMLTIGWVSQARGDVSAEKISLKKENIKPDVNKLALSWGIGGGVEYDVSPSTAIVAGLYYQRIFTDITRDKGNYNLTNANEKSDEDSKAVLNGLTIRLGIIF